MASRADAFPRFSFGNTVNDVVTVIGRNFLVLGGLALLLYGIPSAIFMVVLMDSMTSFLPTLEQVEEPADLWRAWLGAFGPKMGISVGATIILSVLTQSAMLWVVIEALRGERPGFVEAIGAGFRHFLPVLGVTILSYIIVAVAVALPIAGGVGLMAGGVSPVIFFFLFLFVSMPLFFFVVIVLFCALPAVIAERVGIFGALARSWDLARGHRWKLLAMILIFGLVTMIVSTLLSSATTPFMMMGGTDPDDPFAGMSIIMAIQSLLGSLTLMVTYPFIGATYFNLRVSKEGLPSESITDIFE